MRRLLAVFAALAALTAARAVRADGGEGVSLFPSTGPYRAGAEVETAAFRFDGHRGSYESLVARAEWTAVKHLAVRLRIPYDTVSLRDEPATREGFADSELRIKVVIKGGDPLRITGGVVTSLPTGARHAGLGNGSVQVSPFLNAGYRVDRLILYATIADSISVATPKQAKYQEDAFPNYVDPSTSHEVRATVGTIYNFDDAVGAGFVMTDTIILTEPDRGTQIVDASFSIGAQPDQRLRLVIAPSLPLAGQQRFSWKLNATASISF